jgi:hypothetical protein
MEKLMLKPGKNLRKYYTEYPTGEFLSSSDNAALGFSTAKVIYRESDTEDGRPFVFIRDTYSERTL